MTMTPPMNTYPLGPVTGPLVTVQSWDAQSPLGFTETDTGDAADPEIVSLSVYVNSLSPTLSTYESGTTAGPYTIVRKDTGLYTAEIDCTNAPGEYTYWWAGTGTVQATKPNTFYVTTYPK
jgi:hypothetical protein